MVWRRRELRDDNFTRLLSCFCPEEISSRMASSGVSGVILTALWAAPLGYAGKQFFFFLSSTGCSTLYVQVHHTLDKNLIASDFFGNLWDYSSTTRLLDDEPNKILPVPLLLLYIYVHNTAPSFYRVDSSFLNPQQHLINPALTLETRQVPDSCEDSLFSLTSKGFYIAPDFFEA